MRAATTSLLLLTVSACTATPEERNAAARPEVDLPVATAVSAKPVVAKSKPGYLVKNRDGKAVYCRRETPTGSRRSVENCYTPEQLADLERSAREMRDGIQRQRNSMGCGNFCNSGN